MRRARIAAMLVMMVTALPQGAASAAGPTRGAADPGLLGGEATGTGVLPTFRERGANLIRLQGRAFDPLEDTAPRTGGIPVVRTADLATTEVAYWLVQVEGQRFADATAAIEASGALIAGYIHDDTYMVRATPLQVEFISENPAVRWTGVYQPGWRVPVAEAGRPGLLDLEGEQTYRVHLFPLAPGLRAASNALRSISGVRIVEDAGTVVDLRATAAQVPAIASIPAVEWIGIKPRVELLNANARWVNDTGVRDLFGATAPGRLTGAGQTAAVADTGVNYTYDLNGRAHIAFRDCDPDGTNCKEAIYTQEQPGTAGMDTIVDHGTGHRKMVAYFDLGATGPNPYDPSSHGSHVAGSVDGDQPPYDEYTGHDGLAPAANHVHQNIGSSSGGLVLPGDDYDLWRQAYRPRNPSSVVETSGPGGNPTDYGVDYLPLEDARTHNNSYGLIVPVIDEGSAVRLDRFVWDHEDMVIVVSAGNNGPNSGTIGSPSVAKNELSSGASANGRQPMSSIDSMAQFSSHGPTGDGRYGPDVATPGQIIVSVKGGTVNAYHTAQGTSMSGPVLTGLATLVRQYFFDGYAVAGGDGFAVGSPGTGRVHNPSAALVKAALINGAERMRGFYTGDNGNDPLEDGQWPSAGQGFGRVDLDNSLFFEDDPLANWYLDVFRGDTGASPGCVSAGGTDDTQCTSFPVSNTSQQRTFTMHVDEGEPFDLSLSWTDAPDLLPVGSPALVNNLNLIVEDPSGNEYVGNNMNTRVDPTADVEETLPGVAATDVRNLSERVRIAEPEAGDYTITVEAAPIATGNQGFALAASGDLSPAGADSFTPGPGLQVDASGQPGISDVQVEKLSADTAWLRFTTDEPTTAVASVDLGGTAGVTEFEDSYVEDPSDGGFPGLNEDPTYIETSDEYADRLVLSTSHEIRLTGLSPGQTYDVDLTVTDLGDNSVQSQVEVRTPTNAFQPDAGDIAQCTSGQPDCAWAGLPHDMPPRPVPPGTAAPPAPNDNYATQMYASGGSSLGTFLFRIPEETVDPATITGASLEMVSAHNWVVPYTNDPVFSVDLLNEGAETNWESHTHSYNSIRNAPAPARVYPETAYERGAYQRYAFTFRCSDLDALRTSLENGRAAFRYDSNGGGLFSMDIGFNRRSRGPDLRPRLVLHTATAGDPIDEPCDAGTPAPEISELGIHPGITETDDGTQPVTVSWMTDVPSDSLVLFREAPAGEWTQVGSPQRTRVHHVEVFGLDPAKEYQFAVRSTACNGETSTHPSTGPGYDFFRDPPPEIPLQDWFFHGQPDDQAVKLSRFISEPPPASNMTFSQAPPDNTPGTQETTGAANEDFVGNPLAAFWYGPYSGDIQGDVKFSWFWSAGAPKNAQVRVTFFADPDWAGDPVQSGRIIGRGLLNLEGLSPAPSLQEGFVPVDGTVTDNLLIQVAAVGAQNSDLVVHYDADAVPSKFGIPTEPAPPTEPLPLTGPVPPPAATGPDISPPATRTNPLPRDLAAGTGLCGTAAAPSIQITDPDDGEEVPAGTVPVSGTASYDAGTANVTVRARGEGYDSGPVQAQSTDGFRTWSADLDLSGQQGKTITIRARLFVDGSEVDLDRVDVTVGEGQGGGGGGDVCARLARSGDTRYNVIVGTGGKDKLVGTPAQDAICGRGGKDKIRGQANHDILVGGPGNDRLIGAGGRDKLQAGKGNDKLNGGVGKDRLVGHKGNDRMRGGGGKDFLNGMGGNDVCHGGGGKNRYKRCEDLKK